MNEISAAGIEASAADWVARIDREGRHAALMAEIDAWIGEDSRRRGALLQAEAAWSLLGEASIKAASDGIEDFGNDAGSEPAGRWGGRRRLWLAGGIAAMLALTLGITTLRIEPEAHYATAVGEIRRVPLADGSVASINSDADISIKIGERARVAEIRRGEAWFQVAKDAARPFTVEAGRVRVRAVGTAFAVRRRGNGADVLVTEGVVEAWADGAEGHRIRLKPGQRAFVADNAAIRETSAGAAAVDRALAWRAGRLDLAGETLDHAIAELNRYNARKLVLAAPSLGSERLHGVFRTDDPDAFANAVAESFHMTVDSDKDTITLRAR